MGIRNDAIAAMDNGALESHNPAWGFVTRLVALVRGLGDSHNPAWGFVTRNCSHGQWRS